MKSCISCPCNLDEEGKRSAKNSRLSGGGIFYITVMQCKHDFAGNY